FRIVVAHHPFLGEEGVHANGRPAVMVKRAARALSTFARAEVDIVLAGHLHRTYAATYPGNESTTARVIAQKGPPAHRVMTIQAGTALSARTRGEANSFNRIEIADRCMRVSAVTLTAGGWRSAEAPLAEVCKPAAEGP
ncbi:MAG: hypothetical protein AAFW98_02255, partial [Pseudomonadota bacterium]